MRLRILKLCVSLPALFLGSAATACPLCNPQIKAAIYDSQFYPNLLTMLSAFFVLAGVVAALSWLSGRRYAKRMAANPSVTSLSPVPLLTTAIILGIGIGGFIDGIVLHQILQWHEMLSAKIPPTNYVAKSVNMFWDGIFHFFTLVVTAIGIVRLWQLLHRKEINRSGYLLSGGLLMGWGLFNLIEGVIDHHILKLHNVREVSSAPEVWNFGFLTFAVVLLAAGYGLQKRGGEQMV